MNLMLKDACHVTRVVPDISLDGIVPFRIVLERDRCISGQKPTAKDHPLRFDRSLT